jgi:hypothetical protein
MAITRDEPVWFWVLALLVACPAGAVIAVWVIGGGLITPLIGGTFAGCGGAAAYVRGRRRRLGTPPIL